MNRVYLDPAVLQARPEVDPAGDPPIATDAAEAVRNLIETGHEVLLVSDRPVRLPSGFPKLLATERIDDADGSWFLTGDPELCGRRQAGLRTILVGPGRVGRRESIQRCDIRTRDLRAAVLEILAREAMAPVG